MNNELRILPLRDYEVYYILSIDQNDVEKVDKFQADNHNVEDGRNIFRRTGNIIREYQIPLIRIIVTPVDGE